MQRNLPRKQPPRLKVILDNQAEVAFGVEQDIENEEDQSNEHLPVSDSFAAVWNKTLGKMASLVHSLPLELLRSLVERAGDERLVFVVGEVRSDEESWEVESEK